MTTTIKDLYDQSSIVVEVPQGVTEYVHVDHELFARMIIDLVVECVRDELRDPKSSLTYEQCSRLQKRIREQFQKE